MHSTLFCVCFFSLYLSFICLMKIRVFDLTNTLWSFPIHIIISILLIFGFARLFVVVILCCCCCCFVLNIWFAMFNLIPLLNFAICNWLRIHVIEYVTALCVFGWFGSTAFLNHIQMVFVVCVSNKMIHLIFAADFIIMSLYFDVAFIEIYNTL